MGTAMRDKLISALLGILLMFGFTAQAQAVWVQLVGLGPNRAELQINQRTIRIMRPGNSSPEGVKLLSVTTNYADVEANGFQYRLSLGQQIKPLVVLKADRGGHYSTDAIINGRSLKVVVDTGATTVALSRSEAERIGLQFLNGRRVKTRTASGEANGYLITLDYVQVGPILLRGVAAVVTDLPNSPHITLLGMSFLRRLEMATDRDQLRLMQLK